MSDGRIVLERAKMIAGTFITLVADQCEWVEVCGSVRRGKPYVGDIEIVAVPKNRRELLAKLDAHVVRGTFDRAIYGNTVRWGDTYRGMRYMGATVELFLADANNRGFIQALRTGPGDANTLIMVHQKRNRWSVRFSDGYAWEVSYPVETGDGYRLMHKLRVPDEETFFGLCGLPVLVPGARDADVYATLLRDSTQPDAAMVKMLRIEPLQKALF